MPVFFFWLIWLSQSTYSMNQNLRNSRPPWSSASFTRLYISNALSSLYIYTYLTSLNMLIGDAIFEIYSNILYTCLMLEKPSPFSLTETKSTTSALFSHWKNQSSLCYSFEMVYFPCSKNPPDFLLQYWTCRNGVNPPRSYLDWLVWATRCSFCFVDASGASRA